MIFLRENKVPTTINFINGIQIWQYIAADYKTLTYDRFTIRQINSSNIHKLELLISYDGKSHVTKKPLSEFDISLKFTRYFQGNEIFQVKDSQLSRPDQIFPVLSAQMKKRTWNPI